MSTLNLCINQWCAHFKLLPSLYVIVANRLLLNDNIIQCNMECTECLNAISLNTIVNTLLFHIDVPVHHPFKLSTPPVSFFHLFGHQEPTKSLSKTKITIGVAEGSLACRAKPPPTIHSSSSPQVFNTCLLRPRGCCSCHYHLCIRSRTPRTAESIRVILTPSLSYSFLNYLWADRCRERGNSVCACV